MIIYYVYIYKRRTLGILAISEKLIGKFSECIRYIHTVSAVKGQRDIMGGNGGDFDKQLTRVSGHPVGRLPDTI